MIEPSVDMPGRIFVGESLHAERVRVTAAGLEHDAFRTVSGGDWLELVGNDEDFQPIEPWAHSRSQWQNQRQAEWDELTIRGLRQMASRHGIKSKLLQKLRTICGYFEKNRHRMRYGQYLAAGDLIASGVIEGACRHVVKDRMERTGMNWVIEGAQPMLDLRCIHLCDQWEEFIQFYIATQIKKAHPHRELIASLAWQLVA